MVFSRCNHRYPKKIQSLPFDKNVENPKEERGGNVKGGSLEWGDFPIIGIPNKFFKFVLVNCAGGNFLEMGGYLLRSEDIFRDRRKNIFCSPIHWSNCINCSRHPLFHKPPVVHLYEVGVYFEAGGYF